MLDTHARRLGPGEAPSSIGPRYLIVFNSANTSFRLPEFRAAADFLDVRYCFVPVPAASKPVLGKNATDARAGNDLELPSGANSCDAGPSRKSLDTDADERGIESDRAIMLVHLENDDVAQKLARRVTSIRSIWQHWTSATSIEGVKHALQSDDNVRRAWLPCRDSKRSWRAVIDGFQRSIPLDERAGRIEAFASVLAFQGPIRLRDPEFEWCYTEEWTPPRLLPEKEGEMWEEAARETNGLDGQSYVLAISQDCNPRKQYQRLIAIHVGRNITPPSHELARDRIQRMDVKKRVYIGNTTMESGMSIVQANMALAGPGKLVYDPFAGTGSLLLAAAALGATTLASDIDARMMRGKPHKSSKKLGIIRSAEQYGVEHLLLDSLCFDVTQHPLRCGSLFNAIVADPPYGVRAGAKRLGRRDTGRLRDEPVKLDDGIWSHEHSDYFPPRRPYALHDLLADLFAFAAFYLVPGGRLVFWMPTMSDVADEEQEGTEELTENDLRSKKSSRLLELQLPPTKSLRLLAHSLQDFGSWGRRLITMEKVHGGEVQDVRLPDAPATHLQPQSVPSEVTTNGNGVEKKHAHRIRATDDPNDFRNQFFGARFKARQRHDGPARESASLRS